MIWSQHIFQYNAFLRPGLGDHTVLGAVDLDRHDLKAPGAAHAASPLVVNLRRHGKTVGGRGSHQCDEDKPEAVAHTTPRHLPGRAETHEDALPRSARPRQAQAAAAQGCLRRRRGGRRQWRIGPPAQFAAAAKISDGDKVEIKFGSKVVIREFKLDSELKGTIALNPTLDDVFDASRYRFEKSKIVRVVE